MNKPLAPLPQSSAQVDWNTIETVMLDMDGTLLDKYFDDYFWEKYVPRAYGEKHQLTAEEAESALLEKYRSVENTLQWTDLHYWTRRLGLDIIALNHSIDHLVDVHDGVIPFLEHQRKSGRQLFLVTNAHPKTLEIKLAKTAIERYFDAIVCADEVGKAKEQVDFWHRLEDHLDFDKDRTFFADDTEKVLRAAREYGIAQLLHIAKPSSRLPLRLSAEFASVADFREIF